MLIGIIGAPNKGKSLLFSCLTSISVPVADYPFTTIQPNQGVAILTVPCAHVEMGLPKCDARGGHCKNGMREIAIPLLDVAGLVPGASEGRGMGNQFLDDLRMADGFIQVVDASERTDLEGKPTEKGSIEEEIDFLGAELEAWLGSVIERNAPKFRHHGIAELGAALSGLGYDIGALGRAAAEAKLRTERIEWSDEEIKRFAHALYASGKPRLVAANKADVEGANGKIAEAQKEMPNTPIRSCSAMYEHVLQKAMSAGVVKYTPEAEDFEIVGNVDGPQKAALARISAFMKENRGTGVQAALRELVFDRLGMMVVYPVEDENHFTDRKGLVLPDALLVPRGSTVIDMAGKVHTDLAKNFIGAVDCKTKRRVGREHPLQFGNIIKIVAGR